MAEEVQGERAYPADHYFVWSDQPMSANHFSHFIPTIARLDLRHPSSNSEKQSCPVVMATMRHFSLLDLHS